MKRLCKLAFILALTVIAVIPCLMIVPSSAKAMSARGMAVIEAETGRLLYSHHADLRLPMASTTKIVTAITVIEHVPLNDVVAIDRRAVGVEGSSVYLAEGEKMTVEDLLYCLMLQSGNDAAEALAYHTAGSPQEFAAMMNQTAKKAGAENSNFVTPHGLHDDQHYTTALDLARITAYALKNETFAKIAACQKHTVTRAEGRYPTVILNKNKLLAGYQGATGVKTGYTKQAGRCLVASAKRNGMQVISVVLNDGPMFEDCAALMDQAFSEYELTEILPSYSHVGQIDTVGSLIGNVHVYTKQAFRYPLTEAEKPEVFCRLELPETAVAPIKKDSVIGKIKIYLLNQLLFSTEIYTIEDIQEITFKDHLNLIIDKWLRRG